MATPGAVAVVVAVAGAVVVVVAVVVAVVVVVAVAGRPEMSPADRFHAHPDGCVRCRTTPFSLCAEGSVLLHLAARAPGVPREEKEK